MSTLIHKKIKSIRKVKLDNITPVYDIEVPMYSNFALANGIIVHNSKDMADALAGSVYRALSYKQTDTYNYSKDDANTLISVNRSSSPLEGWEVVSDSRYHY